MILNLLKNRVALGFLLSYKLGQANVNKAIEAFALTRRELLKLRPKAQLCSAKAFYWECRIRKIDDEAVPYVGGEAIN